MNKKVGIIGAPITIAQPNDGVDLGPKAIRYAGLINRLEKLNLNVIDYGDLNVTNERLNENELNLKNLENVATGNELIAQKVIEVVNKDEFPLILGGDHSIAIGSIAGLADKYKDLGVIWYDAHADLNNAETSPSGNIHGMSLAVCLGNGHERLTSINGNQPKINPENVVLIGARDLDDGEKELIKQIGIKLYTMTDIEEKGMQSVIEETLDYLKDRTDGIHLSLDVDGLDPIHTPGTGTPVIGGITYRETILAMQMLNKSHLITSAEVVEVNPLLDQQNQTAEVAVDIISALFGETYN